MIELFSLKHTICYLCLSVCVPSSFSHIHIHIQNQKSSPFFSFFKLTRTERRTTSDVHSQPRRPTVYRAASKVVWPVGQDRWFCPSFLLWWDPTWSPVSSSGAHNNKKDMDLLEWVQRRAKKPWRRSEGGASLLWGKAARVGAVQPGEACRVTL